MRWMTAGEMVLMSITIKPGCEPSRTPSGPPTTRSTSGESGRQVTTTSAFCATSRTEPTTLTPSGRSSSTAALARLPTTTTGKPALRRFFVMGFPMMPSPMKPTRFM